MKEQNCPMDALQVLDRYFLENRARLLDVAAFLDRVDRASQPDHGRSDVRYRSFLRALHLLLEPGVERARAVQMSLSDRSAHPRASAAGLKGACGTWEKAFDEDH